MFDKPVALPKGQHFFWVLGAADAAIIARQRLGQIALFFLDIVFKDGAAVA